MAMFKALFCWMGIFLCIRNLCLVTSVLSVNGTVKCCLYLFYWYLLYCNSHTDEARLTKLYLPERYDISELGERCG